MPETYEDFFKDGVNCVTFKNDLSDFEEKLNYWKDSKVTELSLSLPIDIPTLEFIKEIN